MPFDSPLTLFALAISPIVAVVFVSLYWVKRDQVAQPSIVAAIPLGLISIAILLTQSAVLLIATFNEIASRRTAGMKAVIAGLLAAQRPFIWGFVDSGVCLIIIFLASAFFRYSRDEETPLIHAYISLPALIGTTAAIVGLFVIVYMQYSTVDLVMMIVDNHRYHDLVAQFGTASPAYFASRISSRLIAIAFLSPCLVCLLIAVGVADLFWRQKQDSRQAFGVVLTLGTVIGCGVSVLSELAFVDYLQHVR
jgi:hypothetical protein